MPLKPITHLPKPETEHPCELQLLYRRGDQQEPHQLVYEIQRDFLSAPKQFAHLSFWGHEQDWLDINSHHQYSDVEYDETGALLARGIFTYETGEDHDAHTEYQHIVISVMGRRLEFVCTSLLLECVSSQLMIGS